MQKRTEVRRSTILPTEVSSPYWSETQDLIAADISPRGMYIISEKMPRIGDCLCCTFSLNQEVQGFYFFGRVKRINWHRRKSDRLRPGFGVEFMDVSPRKFVSLERALRGLPPPIPSKNRVDDTRRASFVRGQPGDTMVSKWYWHQTQVRKLNY